MNHPYLQTFNLVDFCKPAAPVVANTQTSASACPKFAQVKKTQDGGSLASLQPVQPDFLTTDASSDKHEKAKKQKKLQQIYNDIEKVLSHY